jgi:hypothetical protein
MVDKSKNESPQKTAIKRFPRLTTGSEAAAIAKLLWTNPNFNVRVNKHSLATEFVFSVPFPEEVKHEYAPVKRLFFEDGAPDWETALAHSYWKTSSGKKVSHFIPNLLHLVLTNGMKQWLEKTMTLAETQQAVHELQSFKTQNRTKRGQQPEPRLALWTAMRHEELLEQIASLKKRFKKKKWTRSSELWRAIERIVGHDVVCKALKELVDNENIEAIFVDRRVSVERIARAMLKAELEQKPLKRSNRPLTLDKYLKLGDELRILLAALPRPFRIRTSS